MLILTRKVEQGIVIDGNIVVRVLAVDGERVKIGVDAPRSITVLRAELLAEVADENHAALAKPADRSALAGPLRRFERRAG